MKDMYSYTIFYEQHRRLPFCISSRMETVLQKTKLKRVGAFIEVHFLKQLTMYLKKISIGILLVLLSLSFKSCGSSKKTLSEDQSNKIDKNYSKFRENLKELKNE